MPVNLRRPIWRVRFGERDTSVLLAFELERLNLELRPSNIPGAGLGFFTTKPLGANALVGYLYGTLIYDDPTKGPSSQASICREGTMAVPVNEFHTMCLQLLMKYPFGKCIWIYPAPFCAMIFINNGRYLPNEVDRPTPALRSQNPHAYQKNNVQFQDSSTENVR